MNQETVNILADAIKEYYGDYELEELCNQYNIDLNYLGVSPNHKKLASKMISKKSQNYQRFVRKNCAGALGTLQSSYFEFHLGKQCLR